MIRSILLALLPVSSFCGPFNFYNPLLHNYGLINYADVAAQSGFRYPQVQAVPDDFLNVNKQFVQGAASARDNDVCLTEACVINAANILKQMDRSVNPCDDFYSFACGGFVKDTVLPEHKTRTGFNMIWWLIKQYCHNTT